MTIPAKQNCPHQGEGWCLDCVGALSEKYESLKKECSNVAKRTGPFYRQVREGGGEEDVRMTLVLSVSQLTDAYYELKKYAEARDDELRRVHKENNVNKCLLTDITQSLSDVGPPGLFTLQRIALLKNQVTDLKRKAEVGARITVSEGNTRESKCDCDDALNQFCDLCQVETPASDAVFENLQKYLRPGEVLMEDHTREPNEYTVRLYGRAPLVHSVTCRYRKDALKQLARLLVPGVEIDFD